MNDSRRKSDRAFSEILLAQAQEDVWPHIEKHIYMRFSASPAEGILDEMAQYHFATGGKRLRALIPAAILTLLKRSAIQLSAFPAAIEVLHNATLIHDDLQDGDETRRGRETVWKKYGDAQAINSGDAYFFYAMGLLESTPIPDGISRSLFRIFTESSLQVIRGQADEFVEKETLSETSVEAYLRVVEGKTGGLLGLPLRGAALIAFEDLRYDDLLRRIGNSLGTIFQIQDDLLDVIGEKGRGYKAADLAEGKPSYLAIHGLQHGTTQERANLLEILQKPREKTSAEDLDRGIAMLEKTGAIDAALRAIEQLEAGIYQDTASLKEEDLARFLNGLTGIFLAPLQTTLNERQKSQVK